MIYLILAAGEGSRFVKEGIETPKPLVPIMGEPMIGRLIHLLMKFDAEKIIIVSNSRMPGLTEYLENLRDSENLPLDIRPVVSHSSYYSLYCGVKDVQDKFIAMTVDTIFPVSEFGGYVDATKSLKGDEVVMGLTKYVDDESPLYALVGPEGYVIDYKYGGDPFPGEIIVSAGLYGVTPEAMTVIKSRIKEPESLSDFQRILAAETDIKVKVYEFSKAMDVDRTHDQAVAERFIKDLDNEL